MSEPLLTPEIAQLACEIDSQWRSVANATSGPFATYAGLCRAEETLKKLVGSTAANPVARLLSLVQSRLDAEYLAIAGRELARAGYDLARMDLDDPAVAAKIARRGKQSIDAFVAQLVRAHGRKERPAA